MFVQRVTLHLYDGDTINIFLEKKLEKVSFQEVLSFEGKMEKVDNSKVTHLHLRWADVKILTITDL